LRSLDGAGTHGRLETVREIFNLDGEAKEADAAGQSEDTADVLPLTRRGSDRRA